jgi:NADH-ubiquinone oxidoreductase chain 4L
MFRHLIKALKNFLNDINLYFYTMNLSLILFTIGILGFVLNRKNIILMLISIEIMLLAITFLILVSSLSFDDILGQTYAIYIIAIAGAESAIGLGILVAFYRLRGSISIEFK